VAELPAEAAFAALPSEVAFYRRLGLLEDAALALRAAEGAVRKLPAGDALLAGAYQALGEYARPHAIAVRAREGFEAPPSNGNAWVWRSGYARPHEPIVSAAASAEGVDPELVYAVMRKESGFDPRVVSYADAVGLMQILPKTAEKIARERGEAYARERLFDPETSIRWAAHLLGRLRRELGGQDILAIAAYNAGAHKVLPWLLRETRRGEVDLDVFVERIPIEQTRNYVRRVVGAWARYEYLKDPARGWPFELPARLRR
jgi:soluble lytic murein transglycosylase